MALRFKTLLPLIALLTLPPAARGATLSISPASGAFTVGSTFEAPIYLDTEGESINAVAVFLKFPPDKLQLVSPSAGRSIIGLWPTPPRFNNQRGTAELQGLVPNGLNTSNGLVTTLTFRVKAVGQAVIKFLDESKVLLNDGQGTEVLDNLSNGIYQLVLPPPAGPLVSSATHPDQTKWYASANAALVWAPVDEPAAGYSYVLDDEPTTVPDDITEGQRTNVVYKNLADGTHYFHLKSLRDGVWGGVTHFALLVDTAAPAEFKIDIAPAARTTRRQPLIQWPTSDAASGPDHSELKLIPLTPSAVEAASGNASQLLFIEASSPYLPPPLERGQYDVIVRVYDRAGNHREAVERLAVVNALFKPIAEQGLEVGGALILPWLWVWLFLLAAILLLWRMILKIRDWHRALDEQRAKKILPAEIRNQLEELKQYRAKYGRALLILLSLSWLGSAAASQAAVSVAPPTVTTVSRAVTNEEIFYVGGQTEAPGAAVVIYLQNLGTGETTGFEMTSDAAGEWFYRHHTFLASGNYQLWVQSRVGEEWSPPSPQFALVVRATAFQFGVSRLSYSVVLFGLVLILAVALLGLTGYVVIHGLRGRQKRARLLEEIREAEESVRRGFAVLRRDIAAELAVIKKAKLNRELAGEEKLAEAQLLKDLAAAERYIGREIWEVEQAEG